MIRLSVLLLFLCTACGNDVPELTEKFNTPQSSTCKEAAVENQFLVRWKNGSTTVEHAGSRDEFITEFLTKNNDDIAFAEHNYIVTIDPVGDPVPGTVVDDGINPMDVDPEDWGQSDSEAKWAWTNGLYGQEIIVAVIDSGADITHPQLINTLYQNSAEFLDGIDNDDNGYVDDVHGWNFVHWQPEMKGDTFHGTHVSGIILADHSTGPMKGVAPGAKLLPLKFIDGSSGFLSDAIFAIDYAVGIAKRENKPLVINASWGGSDCSVALRKKMDEFNSRRVLFAVAAGNNGRNISSSPVYPAAYNVESQITIGAHSARNVLASFSNFGVKVDLTAPGFDIFSLAPGGEYARAHGTSMATPFVAGTAALLWGQKPNATTAQIKKAIFDSIVSGPFNVRLQGKLNVRKAKLALDQL